MIESFDINTYTPVNILTIPNVSGSPVKLIRWGTNGLAFLTYGEEDESQNSQEGNDLFLINDSSFVGNTTTNPDAKKNMVHKMAASDKVRHP